MSAWPAAIASIDGATQEPTSRPSNSNASIVNRVTARRRPGATQIADLFCSIARTTAGHLLGRAGAEAEQPGAAPRSRPPVVSVSRVVLVRISACRTYSGG